jgi:hypothetical protein
LSDEQLNVAIQSLRDEQRYRREDARLYQSEVDMRRKIRWWP